MLQFLTQSTSLATNNNNNNVKQKTIANDAKQSSRDALHDEGSDEKLALFHRHEINVGELVGTGSFSEVYEISSFDLLPTSSSEGRKSSSFLKASLSSSTSLLTPSASTQPLHLGPSRRRKRKDILTEHEQNSKDQRTGRALQSRYVIKHLHQKLLQDPKLFRRAVRDMATEAAIMQDINHPHIARLRAAALNGTAALANGKHDSFFLVLDRLFETLDDRIESWNHAKLQQGPSFYLDSAINDERLALKANYAWQIASALQYLHERRIVYRDLKPQNIGFKNGPNPDHPEQDVLALFDFGLARNLPTADKANPEGLFRMSLVGTRRYMAPEVVLTKTYNEKADSYSWALVFFELVTQVRPYDGIQRNEHKEHICQQGKRPKLYSYYGLPKELETMLRLSWAQDVSKRLTLSEICLTLKAFLAGTIHKKAVLPEIDASPIKDDDESSLMTHTSFSSLASVSTSDTEQSTATSTSTIVFEEANPASMTLNHLKLKGAKQDASPAPDTESIVPQAISVSSPGLPGGDEVSHHTADFACQKRRISLCERFLTIFRTGIMNKIRFFRF